MAQTHTTTKQLILPYVKKERLIVDFLTSSFINTLYIFMSEHKISFSFKKIYF